MNAKIRRSHFEATELTLLSRVKNEIGLMINDKQLPTLYRNHLRLIWRLLDQMMQARKDAPQKLDAAFIKTKNGIEEWPESNRDRWEALK